VLGSCSDHTPTASILYLVSPVVATALPAAIWCAFGWAASGLLRSASASILGSAFCGFDLARSATNHARREATVPMGSTPNKAAEPQRKGDFEKSLARLEEVVKRLESTELSLDEAMRLFEEGVKLSRDCQKQLEEAEGRVEILLKKADGKIAAEPFEPEDESS